MADGTDNTSKLLRFLLRMQQASRTPDAILGPVSPTFGINKTLDAVDAARGMMGAGGEPMLAGMAMGTLKPGGTGTVDVPSTPLTERPTSEMGGPISEAEIARAKQAMRQAEREAIAQAGNSSASLDWLGIDEPVTEYDDYADEPAKKPMTRKPKPGTFKGMNRPRLGRVNLGENPLGGAKPGRLPLGGLIGSGLGQALLDILLRPGELADESGPKVMVDTPIMPEGYK